MPEMNTPGEKRKEGEITQEQFHQKHWRRILGLKTNWSKERQNKSPT